MYMYMDIYIYICICMYKYIYIYILLVFPFPFSLSDIQNIVMHSVCSQFGTPPFQQPFQQRQVTARCASTDAPAPWPRWASWYSMDGFQHHRAASSSICISYTYYNIIWYDMIWYDMIWYDMYVTCCILNMWTYIRFPWIPDMLSALNILIMSTGIRWVQCPWRRCHSRWCNCLELKAAADLRGTRWKRRSYPPVI